CQQHGSWPQLTC
nr:immunoglobulin light chain junction region [Macaca mulatta]